jgi:hypothetical protein
MYLFTYGTFAQYNNDVQYLTAFFIHYIIFYINVYYWCFLTEKQHIHES